MQWSRIIAVSLIKPWSLADCNYSNRALNHEIGTMSHIFSITCPCCESARWCLYILFAWMELCFCKFFIVCPIWHASSAQHKVMFSNALPYMNVLHCCSQPSTHKAPFRQAGVAGRLTCKTWKLFDVSFIADLCHNYRVWCFIHSWFMLHIGCRCSVHTHTLPDGIMLLHISALWWEKWVGIIVHRNIETTDI